MTPRPFVRIANVPRQAPRLFFPVFFLCTATATGLSAPASSRLKVQSYAISTSPRVHCVEYELPSDQEDDQVDLWYLTQRKQYDFTKTNHDNKNNNEMISLTVPLRKTSFGCGKLGGDIWPCSLAMCLHLLEDDDWLQDDGHCLLEVGAGCGLPSVMCAALGGRVVATDYWQEETDETFDKDRLVPTHHHGMNLQYNLDQIIQPQQQSSILRLDWHDPATARAARELYRPNLIVGSDVVYYPMDVEPLLTTLQVLLEPYDDEKIRPPRAILMAALPPTIREALPDFRQKLPEYFPDHHVEMEEILLDYQERREQVPVLKIQILPK